MVGLMTKKNSIPRQSLSQTDPSGESVELEALRTLIRELQLEVDVLKETIEVLKKDPDVDLTRLTNREKAAIIGVLEKKYALSMLLAYFHIAKSSYYYQKAALSKPDKYMCYREKIKQLFRENRSVYGYRRLHPALRREGVVLSEKIIRKIMQEENLVVFRAKKVKYSSYLGEIPPEV